MSGLFVRHTFAAGPDAAGEVPDQAGALEWRIESDGFRVRPNALEKHVPKDKKSTVVSPFAVAAIRLLLFTGARLREILHLEWYQVRLVLGLIENGDHR